MNIITFDIPLLIIGLSLLIWLRVTQPNHIFQIWCQLIATFWAQYSWIVSWSLQKMVPLFSASYQETRTARGVRLFVPFVIYTILSSLVASMFWVIPTGVSPMYGEYRLWVQLFIFATIILSTRGLLSGLLHHEAPILLWNALTLAVIIHGIFSIYQYVAWQAGLPLLGISRAHGQTMDYGIADTAAFAVQEGGDLIRPGGLAGEPKTVAIIYGIYIVAHTISGFPQNISKRKKLVGVFALMLSIGSFFMAFSTSAFIGGSIALSFGLVFFLKGRAKIARRLLFVVLLLLFSIMVGQLFSTMGFVQLFDIFKMRTIDRLVDNFDPPVEAALRILWNNPFILLFGTGYGGASFSVMHDLGTSVDFALSPNVGGVLLLLESGLIGSLLFLAPFAILARKSVKGIWNEERPSLMAWNSKFLCSVGVSAMCFMLSGSGIAMGYVLSVGCIGAAAHRVSQSHLPDI